VERLISELNEIKHLGHFGVELGCSTAKRGDTPLPVASDRAKARASSGQTGGRRRRQPSSTVAGKSRRTQGHAASCVEPLSQQTNPRPLTGCVSSHGRPQDASTVGAIREAMVFQVHAWRENVVNQIPYNSLSLSTFSSLGWYFSIRSFISGVNPDFRSSDASQAIQVKSKVINSVVASSFVRVS